jgi:hypothetical protein
MRSLVYVSIVRVIVVGALLLNHEEDPCRTHLYGPKIRESES